MFISLWAFKNYIFNFLGQKTGYLGRKRALMPGESTKKRQKRLLMPQGFFTRAEPGFIATFLCTPLEQNKKIGIPFLPL